MTTEDLIFEKHYEYYKNIGIETIKQQAGQVEQVSSDYQGRVIYELLQNAFDKAEKRILVMVRGNSLYVANDGDKFTYVADYDYGRGSSKRGDFQSMCSISTSTKSADTSIGNKGKLSPASMNPNFFQIRLEVQRRDVSLDTLDG